MLAAPVILRDPLDGDRPIDLRPTLAIWLALEKTHGPLGQLFIDTKIGRVSLAVQLDLIYRCAKEAGSPLSWSDLGRRVHELGLYQSTELVLALFADIFVPRAEPGPALEGAGVGGPEGESVPLASGA